MVNTSPFIFYPLLLRRIGVWSRINLFSLSVAISDTKRSKILQNRQNTPPCSDCGAPAKNNNIHLRHFPSCYFQSNKFQNEKQVNLSCGICSNLPCGCQYLGSYKNKKTWERVFFYRNSTRQNDKFGVVQNSTYVCSEYQIFNVSNDYFSIDVTGKKCALQCELTAGLPH